MEAFGSCGQKVAVVDCVKIAVVDCVIERLYAGCQDVWIACFSGFEIF